MPRRSAYKRSYDIEATPIPEDEQNVRTLNVSRLKAILDFTWNRPGVVNPIRKTKWRFTKNLSDIFEL